jgi:hypothetical protein
VADAEHVNGQGKHRQVSPPRVGLDWADPKLTVDTTDLLADADLATAQVDISPAQTEDPEFCPLDCPSVGGCRG